MKKLVLVESPTKAKMLSKFLGDEFHVEATMGHIRDLPPKKVGIEIERSGSSIKFIPQYELVEKQKARVAQLQKVAKNIGSIILATDPDREGEAIAWHTAILLNGENSKFSRVVFHQITKDAILDAMKHPRPLDMNLVHAQQARRVLDRLVGYKLSPLLWKKIRRGLSAGRVKIVAVRLIVDREREIKAFVSVEYWDIFADLSRQENPSDKFRATLTAVHGQKPTASTQAEIDPIVFDLKTAAYSVRSVEKKETRRRPFPPFTTSTLQQAASHVLRWTSKKTMSVAQQLYEHGFITYHRTDSFFVASEAIARARGLIPARFGAQCLPSAPRLYKTKSANAQEAHEAIRPTNLADIDNLSGIESTVGNMGREGVRLYELVWRRFLSSQMADQLYDQTTIVVSAKGTSDYTLSAQGQIEKFAGWRLAYRKIQLDGDSAMAMKEEGEGQELPPVQQGELLKLEQLDPQQHFTQPPARYTEAMLIKALEAQGIGRPSTYAPIVTTVQDRGYVEKIELRFAPTSVGMVVNDFLVEYFKNVVDYDFTSSMEQDLDHIASGSKKWNDVVGAFWIPFEKLLEQVEEKAERKKIPVEETGEHCPLCKGGAQVIRTGRFGKFLSCSTFPACKWTAKYLEKFGMKCPDCKEGDIIVKKTRKGKHFYGCSRYPDCKWASWRKPK